MGVALNWTALILADAVMKSQQNCFCFVITHQILPFTFFQRPNVNGWTVLMHRPDAGCFSSEATNWNRFEAVNVCSCPRFDLVKFIGRAVHWSLTKTITTLMADSQNVLYYTVIMVGESRKFVSRRVLEYLITPDRNILPWSPNMPNLILM